MNVKTNSIFTVIYYLVCLAILTFIITPIITVLFLSLDSKPYLSIPFSSFSLQWYYKYASSILWTKSTLLSLEIALTVSMFSTLLGTLAAFGIVRGKFIGRNVIGSLFFLPLIMPSVVIAVGIYDVFIISGICREHFMVLY